MDIKDIKEKINSKNKSFRDLTFSIDRENINDDEQIIPMSVSSEEPYLRWFGYEVLDHSSKSIRLDRFKNGAAFRDTHYGDQIGIIQNPVIDAKNKKLRIDVKFSKNDERAVTIYKDIKDEIRKNVSVRYIVHELILEKEDDENSTYRVTDWEPVHASIEPDPADHSVGVGRSTELEAENKELKSKIKQLTINSSGSKKMEKEITQDQLDKAVNDARKAGGDEAAQRVKGIYATAAQFKDSVTADFDIMAKASAAIEENKSVTDFNAEVFANAQKQVSIRSEEAKIGLTSEQAHAFSISRATQAVLSGNWDKAGFEREVSIAARAKQTGDIRGHFTIPFDVLTNGSFGKRELSVGTNSAGGYLVGTDHLASSFVDVLRAYSVVGQSNATFLDGLVGNISIPKKVSGSVASWIATEGGDASESDMVLGQIGLTPKTIAARTELTRNTLIQTNPAIDRLAEVDLIAAIGQAIDVASLHGTGSNGQPKGIATQTGVGAITGASFDFAKAVSFKEKVKLANAFKGNLKWIGNPSVEADLETKEKAANTARYLLEDEKMAGYPFFSTTQAEAASLFFGDWSQLIIALWGGLDVVVDGISSNDGNVKIKVFQSVDIAVRHAAAFARTLDFSLDA